MSDVKEKFLISASEWLCDGYGLEIDFVSRPTPNGQELVSADMKMQPFPSPKDIVFQIATDHIFTGHVQRCSLGKNELSTILTDAAQGRIVVGEQVLKLIENQRHDYYSETSHRERWFSELHLQVRGGRSTIPPAEMLLTIDNDLRASTPSFDGLSDLDAWLGTNSVALNGGEPSLVVHVTPPVDFVLDRCKLIDSTLTLVLVAHASFETSRIRLAIHGTPDNGLTGRRQIADKIVWGDAVYDKREGVARIEIKDCGSALAILMLGTSTVRRHRILDSAKARNIRYLAVRHFDTELRKIRGAVFDSSDSLKFEQGVAALFFLLGFSPALQIETDSPDILITTPSGQLMLVECTTRIADFSAKLGKLVDRRGSLSRALTTAGHPRDILAILVCRLPRDQIAVHEEQLRIQMVLLWAGEELANRLDCVRDPSDPDKLFENARDSLETFAKILPIA